MSDRSIGQTIQKGFENLFYMVAGMILCVTFPIYTLLEHKWEDPGHLSMLYDISSVYCLLAIFSLFFIGFKWTGLLFSIMNLFVLINFILTWMFTDINYIQSTWNDPPHDVGLGLAIFHSFISVIIGWVAYKVFRYAEIAEYSQ